jgi:hypothetical protein
MIMICANIRNFNIEAGKIKAAELIQRLLKNERIILVEE